MNTSRVTDYFRKPYELRSAVAWGASAVYCVGLNVALTVGPKAIAAMLSTSVLMAALRTRQVMKLWDFKVNLAGKAVQVLPAAALQSAKAKLDGDVWLGWGFRWEPRHAQLANDVLRRSMREIYPPQWYLKFKGVKDDPRKAKGLPWIHGLDEEGDITLPMKALEGHTGMLAITGAIKTTMLRLLVYQFAAMGDVVIVLDPKGDLDLKKICREVPESLGRPDKFAMFHPAFSTESMRFDALSAWDRETQVASRIQMLLSADEDNNFVSFVWMQVTNIVGCMKRIGYRTSFSTLLEHVQSQSSAENLCERVLQKFLSERDPQFESILADLARQAEEDMKKPSRSKGPQLSSPRLSAMIGFFKNEVPSQERPKEITGLITALESNREWFGKMIITLTPMLTKLSSGDLDALLSPNYEDIDDRRPILNSRKLIDGGYVAYFGLDALSDASVASAIAAVVLADLASTAGEIYNYDLPASGGKKPRRVHVIIDEWGDALCEPVIHGCNKGRGAGLIYMLAGQTFSDVVAKVGDVAKAKRIVGNLNNLIVGATNDADTLDIIQSKLGETEIVKHSMSQGAGQKTEDAGLEYSANRSVSSNTKDVDLVPRNLIQALPDLQFIAIANRAAVYKGRIPVLTLQ
jgi:conjugal transfer pilus assembly protein TraD